MQSKTVCVMGLGYIGLPTAALLANRKYHVHGVDVVESTVETINQGKIHIVEPDLDTFVRSAVNSGNLIASTTPKKSDIFIIAVPTPFHEGYVPDIDYVISATESIVPYVEVGNTVILESTSPIGTTEKVAEILEAGGVDISKIYIAHCPERVLPGHIMQELVQNDRIVGGINEASTKEATAFYKTFVKGKILQTDSKTAEMAKLTENSFRDVNIAFANELSILSDKFGIDVWELISLANRHPRVNILQPGVGVGGHCIAVDPWFIVHSGGSDAKIIKSAREVNNYKAQWSIQKVKDAVEAFEKSHDTKAKVACMGLAFKPNIDDLRESPALLVTKQLIAEGITVLPVEPNLKSYSEFTLVEDEEAINEADIILFLVAHDEFKGIRIFGKTVFDFCGVTHHKES